VKLELYKPIRQYTFGSTHVTYTLRAPIRRIGRLAEPLVRDRECGFTISITGRCSGQNENGRW